MAVTRAVDFGALVGGQLTALIEAEAAAAEASSEYIEKVGFERKANGSLVPRMVTFEMQRRDTDGKTRTHRISIPVLILVPIPLLSIAEANLEFELQIEQINEEKVEETREGEDQPSRGIAGFLGRKTKSKLMTRVARTSRETGSTKTDLRMSVRITQSDFPIGIERLLNVTDLSTDDTADG